MNFARALLHFILCVVLLVTSGFAATKKTHRNDRSRDWNDVSLQNDSPVQNDWSFQTANLLEAGSGVPSDSSGFQSSAAPGSSGPPLILGNPGTPDNWGGGTGFWSTGPWSAGLPAPGSDVVIYSGVGDAVTLDVSSKINSLTLGGASGGTGSSSLTDGGVAQVLIITSALTVGYTGSLSLTGGSTVSAGTLNNSGSIDLGNGSTLTVTGNVNNSGTLGATGSALNVGTLNNGGVVDVLTGATLNLTNQMGGITDLVAGSEFYLSGTFNDKLAGANGFANLTSVEGILGLRSQNFTVTPGGGTLTIGSLATLEVDFDPYTHLGNNLTINGNVNNSGDLAMSEQPSFGHPTGNTLTISGTLTIQGGGDFVLYGPGDKATLGGLTNSGYVATGVSYGGGGNTLNITGTLTNSGTFALVGLGDTANVATLNNSGTVYVGSGATLNLTNQMGGITDVVAGASFDIAGSFNDVLGGDSAFAHLATVEGALTLENGQTTTVTNQNFPTVFIASGGSVSLDIGTALKIDGALANDGSISVNGGSKLNILGGDVENTGTIITGSDGSGENQVSEVNILGNHGAFVLNGPGDSAMIVELDNDGSFVLRGANATATIGSVVNGPLGTIDLENASTLTVNGDVNNLGYIYTSSHGGSGGNTLTITGTLTNNLTYIRLYGPGDTATIGYVDNSGTIQLENGSSLTANGGITNNSGTGMLYLGTGPGLGGGNTLTIPGQMALTNNGVFAMFSPGDTATVGVLSNSGNIELDSGSTFTAMNEFFNHSGGNIVLNGATAVSDESLINEGFIVLSGSLLTARDITNSGTISTVGVGGNNLEIVFGLTNNPGGSLVLNGPGDMATIGSVVNSGSIDLETGSALTVYGDVTNNAGGALSTSLNGGSGGNTLTINGTLTNSGTFQLNGPGDTATIGGSVNNSGNFLVYNGSMATIGGGLTNYYYLDLENGSTLKISGDVSNGDNFQTGFMATSDLGLGGGNTLTIMGLLSNSGTLDLNGPGDVATIGGNLYNPGEVNVDKGSTLTITGDVLIPRLGGVFTDPGGNNKVNIGGMLDNGGTFDLGGPGDMATIGGSVDNSGHFYVYNSSMATIGGNLTNSNSVDVASGSTLTISGDVDNSGRITTDLYGFGGGNTITIGGMLKNGFTFELDGPGDKATIGSLTNSFGGVVDVENGSTLTIMGAVDNSGTLETNFNGHGGGNTITSNGLLTNEATGQINLNGPGDVLQALAGLSNNGVINVNNGSSIDPPFVNNGGTINIGAGSKMIVGTGMSMGTGYIQLANGTLGEIINGYGPCGNGNCGVINVNGSALLAGMLDIMLKPGFNPVVGSEFEFLTFTGEIKGSFANILNQYFNCNDKTCEFFDYQPGNGFLELVVTEVPRPVPEPATLLVLIPGLMGMAYGLRRRLLK